MGRFFVTTIILLSSVVAATNARAYPTPVDFSGQVSRWSRSPSDGPITYELVDATAYDELNFAGIIAAAADRWSTVPGSYFKLVRASSSEKADISIHLESDLEGASHSAGYTVYDEVDNTGLVHCSIFVGASASMGAEGFAKTVLHELGHCVGLGHSMIPESIMSYSLDRNSFNLDIDDEAAVARLYPIGGKSAKLPPGCSVTTDNGRSSASLSFILLMLLGLIPALTFGVRRRADLG